MRISEIEPGIWSTLRALPAEKGRVVAERIEPYGSNGSLYLCVGGDRTLHFLMEAHKSEAPRLNFRLPRLDVSVRDLKVADTNRKRYIDLRCSSASHAVPFTWLIRELARSIQSAREDRVAAFSNTLRLWKQFWSSTPGAQLSADSQLGLWAELTVLESLLLSDTAGAAAWVGPEGFVQDFRIGRVRVEVKATLNVRHIHRISSLEQLDYAATDRLFLWSFCAEQHATLGTTVWEKAIEVDSRLTGRISEQELFWRKLTAMGLRPEHADLYLQNRFRATDVRILSVTGSFPRLTPSSLRSPLPHEIRSLTYIIDAEGVLAIPFTALKKLLNITRKGPEDHAS